MAIMSHGIIRDFLPKKLYIVTWYAQAVKSVWGNVKITFINSHAKKMCILLY